VGSALLDPDHKPLAILQAWLKPHVAADPAARQPLRRARPRATGRPGTERTGDLRPRFIVRTRRAGVRAAISGDFGEPTTRSWQRLARSLP
jgi:hypothetical protein